MNKAFLIGNLTKDPELRTTAGGLSVCSFTVAVQRRYKDKDGERQADFLPVIVWREMAENCAKYLAKGRKVAVAGEIQTRSYEAKDGSKRYVTEIVAAEVEFLTPKQDNGPSAPQDEYGFAPMEDSELPF